MTSVVRVRVIAAACGVAATVSSGALSGGWWWAAAAMGAAGAVGAAVDRQFGFVQVLAALAGVLGLAATGHVWFVPVLIAGVIGSFELAAAADRTTVVRPAVPDLERVVPTMAAAAALSGMVLGLGALPDAAATAAVLVAAAAAVVAIRVIAR